MSYQLIVFDWDGTLYDSAAFIVHCVQTAAGEANLPVPNEHDIRDLIGVSYDESLRRLMPNVTPMQAAELVQAYRRCVEESQCQTPTLFPGAEDVIKQLHEQGYYLAIATGKSRYGLTKDLEALNLAQYFIASRCADETMSKPHPKMLFELLDELAMEPERTLMIGDTEYDMNLAVNAGVDALAVSYGVHHVSRLKGEHVRGQIDDIKMLPQWLAQHSK